MQFARSPKTTDELPALRLLPDPEDRVEQELISSRALLATVVFAVAVGAAIRLSYTLSSSFPLHDGGLFFAMTRDLQAAHYRLPEVTSYNGADIPFAYSPLAFYTAAFLNDLGLSLASIFRVVPLLANVALIPAFFLLARRLLPSRVAVAGATILLAFMPRAFLWMIMGGGITRSLGFTFAVFALWAITAAYQNKRWIYVIAASVFGALALLSHIQMAWFVAFSAAVLFVAYGRHRFGLSATIAAAAGAAVLSSPWWITVLGYHGVSPFLSAAQASDVSGNPLVNLLRFKVSSEIIFPMIAACGLAGLVLTLVERRYVLAVWLGVALLADQRAFGTVAIIPLALLGGVAIEHAARTVRGNGTLEVPGASPPGRIVLAIGAFTMSCLFIGGMVAGGSLLTSMPAEERAAMAWVSQNTPPASRVLIMTGDEWYADRTSEWFPYLAARESVATTQGYEWLPDGTFADRLSAYDELQQCAAETTQCLDEWAADAAAPFEYVYVSRLAPFAGRASDEDECCATLAQSLSEDPRYQRVYNGEAAIIYKLRF